MNFAEKLHRLMGDRGLSGRALATELRISNATVAGWLKTAIPQPAQAKLLSDYFRVSVDALLDDALDVPAVTAERQAAAEKTLTDVRARFEEQADPATLKALVQQMADLNAKFDALVQRLDARDAKDPTRHARAREKAEAEESSGPTAPRPRIMSHAASKS